MDQNRFRSPALWVSVAALIAFVLKTYLGYEIAEYDKLVDLVLTVLIGFGVLNNPTNKTNF
jgi:uncharacterized membrane protein